jgi:hypothetical protein
MTYIMRRKGGANSSFWVGTKGLRQRVAQLYASLTYLYIIAYLSTLVAQV